MLDINVYKSSRNVSLKFFVITLSNETSKHSPNVYIKYFYNLTLNIIFQYFVNIWKMLRLYVFIKHFLNVCKKCLGLVKVNINSSYANLQNHKKIIRIKILCLLKIIVKENLVDLNIKICFTTNIGIFWNITFFF